MVPGNNLLPFKSWYFFMFLLEIERKKKNSPRGMTKAIRVTMYFQQPQKEIGGMPPIQNLSSQLPSPSILVKEK